MKPAYESLVQHIQFHGNGNFLWTTNTTQPPQKGKSLPFASKISLYEALNNILKIIPKISPIQRKLFTTLIDIVTEQMTFVTFIGYLPRIADAKSRVQNAIDKQDQEVTNKLLKYIDTIVNYFKELEEIYEKPPAPSAKKTKQITLTSASSSDWQNVFQSGLTYLQSKLKDIEKKGKRTIFYIIDSYPSLA